MGEMNFSSNLNDDGDMDDEDKLFQNIWTLFYWKMFFYRFQI